MWDVREIRKSKKIFPEFDLSNQPMAVPFIDTGKAWKEANVGQDHIIPKTCVRSVVEMPGWELDI